jgi:hypothetical protein
MRSRPYSKVASSDSGRNRTDVILAFQASALPTLATESKAGETVSQARHIRVLFVRVLGQPGSVSGRT